MFRGFLLFFVILSATAFAGIDRNVDIKPVHEALVTRVTALAPIVVISRQPPAPRVESPPQQPNAQMVWIPGYWAWDRDAKDFIWICGIWRLPPNGHHWVAGYWQQDNGWYWVGGYWTETGAQPVIAQKAPPNLPEEKQGKPPNDNSFWAPGYWNYNSATQSYTWLGGSWQPFDLNFVFVSAYWQWRPEGYMFHPAFWDWTLEDRGVAYDCDGGGALLPIAPHIIISRIYCWYPDYHLFFWFHWHCCHDFWDDCWCLPPWWFWNGWWGLNWVDTWWLWWWWGHPGFPPPPWLFPLMLNQMMGPDQFAINFLDGVPMPPFITPNGIPSLEDWLDAIEEQTGERKPLIPEDQLDEAAENAGNKLPETDPSDRPSGDSNAEDVTKPSFDDEVTPDGIAPVPRLPGRPTVPAPLPPKPEFRPPATTAPPPSTYQPPSSRRPQYDPPRVYPPRDDYRPRRPWQRPQRPSRPSRPFFPLPQFDPSDRPDIPETRPPSETEPGPSQTYPNRTPPTQTYPPTQSTPRRQPEININRYPRWQQPQIQQTPNTNRRLMEQRFRQMQTTPQQSEIQPRQFQFQHRQLQFQNRSNSGMRSLQQSQQMQRGRQQAEIQFNQDSRQDGNTTNQPY